MRKGGGGSDGPALFLPPPQRMRQIGRDNEEWKGWERWPYSLHSYLGSERVGGMAPLPSFSPRKGKAGSDGPVSFNSLYLSVGLPYFFSLSLSLPERKRERERERG